MENFKKFDLNESHETTASGSVAAPKEETLKQIQIDYYENKLEGMFRNQADQETELATLRQQLKEREEALKELLPMAQWGYDLLVPFDKKGMGREWPAIIERARKLISK